VRAGQRTKTIVWIAAVILLLGAPVQAEPPMQSYTSGFGIVLRTSEGLYQALPSLYSRNLAPRPISIEATEAPMIQAVATTDEGKTTREVSMSAGLIDLMNHVAHAKAIDAIQPGFFAAYIGNLSRRGAAASPPDIVDPRYWTDSIINDQESYFNQMAGVLIGIHLSHHYLGHYAKYSDKLVGADGKPRPLNEVITGSEWEASVKAGTVNSLDCALATGGARALFQAIDQMPTRPRWAAYLVPPSADLKELIKELDRYEFDFFHGLLKRDKVPEEQMLAKGTK